MVYLSIVFPNLVRWDLRSTFVLMCFVVVLLAAEPDFDPEDYE
jgi:hypothetical protein